MWLKQPSQSKWQPSTSTDNYSAYDSRQQKTNRTIGQKRQALFIMLFVSTILLGAIGTRLVFLQLLQGEDYRTKAEDNRVRIVPKPPVRGNIFDRKGRVLASTRLTHAAYLWPIVVNQPDWPQNRQYLAQLLAIPEESIENRIKQAGYNASTLIRIARSLNPAQITALEEFKTELNGLEVDIETVRDYPNQEIAAHILGYTGELNPEELKRRRAEGYRLGDIVGKMGVEAAYEQQLRGEWGGIQLEVDGAGKVMKVLGQKVGQPGKDVTLTLDLDVQKAAEAALGERIGAVVALNPQTGGVLAMASNPTFDPNIFSTQITPQTWKRLQKKGNPFVNRALRGFPPASTFKVVTATAGMEIGKYPPNTVLNTFAYLNVGGTAFGEWNRAGFGPMGYVRAMAWSSNTFHGQIGRGVGGPTLIKYARLYGFGSKTGIELGEESPGLIADNEWKLQRYNWEWTDGDTVNMSIGQGFTQATPLQVAIMFAVPANGGYRVKPHFFEKGDDLEKWRTSMELKPSTLKTLREGLRAVVTEGTGKALNVPEIPSAAGKSGTAEAPPGETHTWFGGFAPYNNPEIVVVAFAEHSGGGGGSVAGPMVRQVMEAYFKHNKN